MKEKVKELWKLCFDDSDRFIEIYFNSRYSDEINIAIESEGQVISALQMIPYPMTFSNHTIPTSYISGACTHPDFRGKGIMSRLLSQAFAQMLRKGESLSTLIPAEPWLFDYYERMGYAPVFGYATETVTATDTIPSKDIVVTVISEYQEDIYSYLNRKLSERPCCIQHTITDFKAIIADLAVSNGTLFVARKSHEIVGIAITYKEDDCILINELLADNEDAEQSLLYSIYQLTGCKHFTRLMPPTDAPSKHTLGMARIINAKEILQLYAAAFPDDEMQLELHDEQVSANDGYYYLHQGICTFSATRISDTYTQVSIRELTSKLLTPLKPYMSLMMN